MMRLPFWGLGGFQGCRYQRNGANSRLTEQVAVINPSQLEHWRHCLAAESLQSFSSGGFLGACMAPLFCFQQLLGDRDIALRSLAFVQFT